MRHLGVFGALVGCQGGDGYRGDYFILGQGGGEGVGDEIGGGDVPGAGCPLHAYGGAQGGQHGGPVGGRVGVCQVAADGAAIADGRVADAAGGFGQQPVGARHIRVGGDGGVGGQGAEGDGVVADADAPQRINGADVNQHFRARQPETHQRDEAVAAGQQFGVRVIGQQLYGLGD